jgi:tripartite-type tricarboxylate transporter receptor subunit TctC
MANPNVILTTLCLGLQIGVSQVALAQSSYPSRAITIINPFPPGGTSDIVVRRHRLARRLYALVPHHLSLRLR